MTVSTIIALTFCFMFMAAALFVVSLSKTPTSAKVSGHEERQGRYFNKLRVTAFTLGCLTMFIMLAVAMFYDRLTYSGQFSLFDRTKAYLFEPWEKVVLPSEGNYVLESVLDSKTVRIEFLVRDYTHKLFAFLTISDDEGIKDGLVNYYLDGQKYAHPKGFLNLGADVCKTREDRCFISSEHISQFLSLELCFNTQSVSNTEKLSQLFSLNYGYQFIRKEGDSFTIYDCNDPTKTYVFERTLEPKYPD